jgi:two-component system chemotaxis sensor kinase CheA
LESIKDPLTHIIRNCCDHGIETPSERTAKGKTENGTILVKSFHEGGQVIVEIIDNGRGLNYEKILNKAIEKNIITAEAAKVMHEKDIGLLIFAPGFSTADQSLSQVVRAAM